MILHFDKGNLCVTAGGNDVGEPCQFPFIYDMWDDFPYVPATIIRWFSKEIKFENCTNYHKSGLSWCATKVGTNNRYIAGNWGECPDTLNCNLEEGLKLP